MAHPDSEYVIITIAPEHEAALALILANRPDVVVNASGAAKAIAFGVFEIFMTCAEIDGDGYAAPFLLVSLNVLDNGLKEYEFFYNDAWDDAGAEVLSIAALAGAAVTATFVDDDGGSTLYTSELNSGILTIEALVLVPESELRQLRADSELLKALQATTPV